MVTRPELVENFLTRHEGDKLGHITFDESRAFYNGTAEQQFDSDLVLRVQKRIFSCVVCSAVFGDSIPGATPVGHRAIAQ